jgi:hypothetical protein
MHCTATKSAKLLGCGFLAEHADPFRGVSDVNELLARKSCTSVNCLTRLLPLRRKSQLSVLLEAFYSCKRCETALELHQIAR